MKALNILRGVKRLLKDPEKWTKHTMARNRHGSSVHESSPEAKCWCLSGALTYVGRKSKSRDDSKNKARDIVESLVGTIPNWNDDSRRTHKDVLNTLDLAIKKAIELDRKKRPVHPWK